MKKTSRLISLFATLLLLLFFLSASIAVPILCRGWYYSQAEALRLSQATGLSTQVIHGAYDQVMDYLVKGAPFGTGELPWSQSGMAHFADCRLLFRLDFLVLAVSGALLLLLVPVRLRRPAHHFLDFCPSFWALVLTLALLLGLGSWAITDFQGLFTAFHALCFPGKTNWIFDYRADPIILILPEAFWARTGILVGSLMLGGEVAASLLGQLIRRLRTPRTVYEVARRL